MIDKLNQRTHKFTIVLNDNDAINFVSPKHIGIKFLNSLDLDVNYIAVIKHDRDIDNETNHVKTVHYHVVVDLNKVCRIGTMINWISDNFNCNANQISIDKCNSLEMQSRYLLHLDEIEKEKVRYYQSEVFTNDLEQFDKYCNMVIVHDMSTLIARVKEYHYDLELIMANISHYDKWRKYINDLISNYYRKGRY